MEELKLVTVGGGRPLRHMYRGDGGRRREEGSTIFEFGICQIGNMRDQPVIVASCGRCYEDGNWRVCSDAPGEVRNIKQNISDNHAMSILQSCPCQYRFTGHDICICVGS